MLKYLQKVWSLVREFPLWSITKISRVENSGADRLSKFALIAVPNLDIDEEKIFVDYLPNKSTLTLALEMMEIQDAPSRPSWMDPILWYLKDEILPSERKDAKALIHQATNYIIINDMLYKSGFSFPDFRCLHPKATKAWKSSMKDMEFKITKLRSPIHELMGKLR